METEVIPDRDLDKVCHVARANSCCCSSQRSRIHSVTYAMSCVHGYSLNLYDYDVE